MQNKLKTTSSTTPPIAIPANSPIGTELDDGGGLLAAGVLELDGRGGLRVDGVDGGGGGDVLVDGDGEGEVGGEGVVEGDGADGGAAVGGGVDGAAARGAGGVSGGGDVVLVGVAGCEVGAGIDILSYCYLLSSRKFQPDQIKTPRKKKSKHKI